MSNKTIVARCPKCKEVVFAVVAQGMDRSDYVRIGELVVEGYLVETVDHTKTAIYMTGCRCQGSLLEAMEVGA